MKEYSQILRFISFLMIFILLPYLSGCTSTRIISKSDLPLPDSSRYSKYPYVVHSEKYQFLFEKSTISDGILSVAINQIDPSFNGKNKIHLYLSSDSVMKFDTDNILSIPLDGIVKVTIESFDKSNTNAAIAISILGTLALVGAVGLLVIIIRLGSWKITP